MTALALLEEVRSFGVEIHAEGPDLVIRPGGVLPTEVKERLKVAKPEILAMLGRRPVTCAASCYEIESGRFVHHPGDGCKTRPVAERFKARAIVDVACSHCGGRRKCGCVVCWDAARDAAGVCLVCKGTGFIPGWIH